MYETFIEAINQRLIIQLTFISKSKGTITRTCIPFDFGPGNVAKDGLDRYHFYDLNSPEGRHTLSILPDQVIDISLTTQNFEPGNYITWTPKWVVPRDWGIYS
ncbi:MAG: hypothetical protein A2041_12375 [Bacteroidetes bacterium GWA2_31_9b]|nr:MAG: hypothetical protein A2041_12375 [Bacteroidetes bacterium GWA2_31_9b]